MLRLLRWLAVVLAVAAAAPAAAAPALWAARDGDSTVYLFGTMHLLEPNTAWRTERFNGALAQSRELVLEVADVDKAAAMAPIVRAHGLDPAGGLSSKLEPRDRERLAAAIAASGIPAASIERMRPWLAAAALAAAPILKAGFDPRTGVEMELTTEARAGAKPIVGLETVEQQLRFVAERPEAEQIAALRRMLAQLDDTKAKLEALREAWLSGDQARLGALIVDARQGRDAGFDEVIRTGRNRAWASAIEAKLAGAGTSFVAVGAGHMIGPESLLDELVARGVRVERLQ